MLHLLQLKLAVMLLVAMVANAYDIGCLIGDMPSSPRQIRETFASVASTGWKELSYETPIVVYVAHRFTECQTTCTAYHSSSAKSAMWEDDAPFRVPDMYHDTWSRITCQAQCQHDLFEKTMGGMGVTKSIGDQLDEWNFPKLESVNEDLVACDGDNGCIEGVVAANDWDPRLIGQVVYLEVEKQAEDDGWNKDGKLTWDWKEGKVVDCTANCAPYSDTTGYHPKNQPGLTKKNSKFNWKPIQENDGNGYFTRQEHVTPHIGLTVKPLVIKEWKEAPPPEYEYVSEGKLVVDRMRDMASSQEQKDMIRVYDDKLSVRSIIQSYIRKKYNGRDNFNLEDYLYYLQGIDSAEYDSLLQAWREKVKYDLIRPTTYIQDDATDETLLTYGGDATATEPIEVKGRDVEPFIRVMPHSEYPSGSGCLCLAYAEYTKAFVKQEFGDDTIPDMSVGLPDENIDGIPGFAVKNYQFYIGDLDDLTEQCGQSRLWGGMHFTKSVDVTNELCAGIGDLALERMNELRGTGDWGSVWKQGDPRPTCPSAS